MIITYSFFDVIKSATTQLAQHRPSPNTQSHLGEGNIPRELETTFHQIVRIEWPLPPDSADIEQLEKLLAQFFTHLSYSEDWGEELRDNGAICHLKDGGSFKS